MIRQQVKFSDTPFCRNFYLLEVTAALPISDIAQEQRSMPLTQRRPTQRRLS
jgi:hypothetical protein